MFALCLIAAFLKRRDISLYREFLKGFKPSNSVKRDWIEENIVMETIISHFNPKFNLSFNKKRKKITPLIIKSIMVSTTSSRSIENSNSDNSEKSLNDSLIKKKQLD